MKQLFRKKFAWIFTLAIAALVVIPFAAFASSVDVAVVDVTAPTGSVTLAPGASGSITINLSATGNQVGTATFEVYRDWTLSGGTFTGSNSQEFTVPPRAAGDPATTFSTSGTITVAAGHAPGGPHTLTVSVFDITNTNITGAKLTAGSSANYQVTVSAPPPPSDTTPPVITPNVSGTPGNNGWYTSDVTVNWSVVDNESAISSSSGCGSTTINADTAGTTLTCSATSAGGTSSESVTIMRDATAPTISGSASPAANGAGWNNTDVDVSFSCNDNLSGVASCGPDQTLSSEGAGQSATGIAVDNAGNTASATVSGINIDKTAPSVNCGSADGVWHSSDVSIACTATDGVSGLANAGDANFSLTTNVSAGTEDANASTGTHAVLDAAGNSATVGPISGNMVDKKAPTAITFIGGINNDDSFYYSSVPAVPTCSATDGGSGLASCNVTGYSTLVGPHTLTATATDNVGNQSTAPRSYTVLAWTLNGFYQPVDMNGVFNTVKNGATVPLKFEVFAGSTELTNTSIVAFSAKQIACDTSAPVDDIEVTATGGTSLRYDWTAGQFVYNWQTPKLAGKCYSVTMTTQDGSSLTANFKLK